MKDRPGTQRVSVTIVFTDIVDSTARAFALGDQRWVALLERHDGVVGRLARRFGGRVLRHLGDGALMVFPDVGAGLAAAIAVQTHVRALDLELRAGVHTGECELRHGQFRGIVFHVGARLLSLAAAGEVLVSDAVRRVAEGATVRFVARGAHALKGLPGVWPLYAAWPDAAADEPDGVATAVG